jgi:hypothetical protein
MAAGYNLTLLPGKRPVGPVSAIGESARKNERRRSRHSRLSRLARDRFSPLGWIV